MATLTTRNQRSSSVAVKELMVYMLSGFVRSILSSLLSSVLLTMVKFQRLRAAYVAQGGSSRCAETARKGRDMLGGSFFSALVYYSLNRGKGTNIFSFLATPDVCMCQIREHEVRPLPLGFVICVESLDG